MLAQALLFAGGHIAQHIVAILGVAAQRIHIFKGQPTVAHNQNMLQVVAQHPEMAQEMPHRDPLEHHKPGGEHVKQHQHPAGEIHRPGEIQRHADEQKAQQVRL